MSKDWTGNKESSYRILGASNHCEHEREQHEYLNSNKDKYKKPSLDHILPRAKGGNNDLSNLRFITYLENMRKRDMTIDEWENIKNNIQEYFI